MRHSSIILPARGFCFANFCLFLNSLPFNTFIYKAFRHNHRFLKRVIFKVLTGILNHRFSVSCIKGQIWWASFSVLVLFPPSSVQFFPWDSSLWIQERLCGAYQICNPCPCTLPSVRGVQATSYPLYFPLSCQARGQFGGEHWKVSFSLQFLPERQGPSEKTTELRLDVFSPTAKAMQLLLLPAHEQAQCVRYFPWL